MQVPHASSSDSGLTSPAPSKEQRALPDLLQRGNRRHLRSDSGDDATRPKANPVGEGQREHEGLRRLELDRDVLVGLRRVGRMSV